MEDNSNLDREIKTTAVDFSFGELLNLHKDREIVIRPEFQRLFRWSNEQRSRLVESIILGLPIPPIFLIEGNDGVLELIDGLQRTSSILQFLDHKSIQEPELILTGCDILKDLNGLSFNKLPLSTRLKIKRTPIRATIINKSGDSYVKYEIFKRLNTCGSIPSAQEIRNCSSRMVEGGDVFYDKVQEMAKFPPFVESIGRLTDSFQERRAEEELVLRFFAVTLYRDHFKGNVEEWLNNFMSDILFKKVEFNMEKQSKIFESVFKLISEKAQNKAFTRFKPNSEPTGRLAPAYYEATVVAFLENFEAIDPITSDDVVERIQQAFSSKEFKDSTGPGASTITKLHARIEAVSKVFRN